MVALLVPHDEVYENGEVRLDIWKEYLEEGLEELKQQTKRISDGKVEVVSLYGVDHDTMTSVARVDGNYIVIETVGRRNHKGDISEIQFDVTILYPQTAEIIEFIENGGYDSFRIRIDVPEDMDRNDPESWRQLVQQGIDEIKAIKRDEKALDLRPFMTPRSLEYFESLQKPGAQVESGAENSGIPSLVPDDQENEKER